MKIFMIKSLKTIVDVVLGERGNLWKCWTPCEKCPGRRIAFPYAEGEGYHVNKMKCRIS
jgi:hypothetical protein